MVASDGVISFQNIIFVKKNTACNNNFFRISNPPKKAGKQLTTLAVILLFVFASIGTLGTFSKLPTHFNSGIFI